MEVRWEFGGATRTVERPPSPPHAAPVWHGLLVAYFTLITVGKLRGPVP